MSFYWSDEAIATPGNRLDAASVCCARTEDASQERDLHGEIAVFYDRIRPNCCDDVVFFDELTGSIDQYLEHVERACPYFDGRKSTHLVSPEQAPRVEPEVVEQEDFGRTEHVHVPPPNARSRREPKAPFRSGLRTSDSKPIWKNWEHFTPALLPSHTGGARFRLE